MHLRRSPFLVSYWRGGRLIVENYRSGVRVAAAPLALAVLDACGGWADRAALVRRFRDYEPRSVERAIRQLVKSTLLESAARPLRDRPRRDGWTAWDPAAGLLHFSSKNLSYRAAEIGGAELRARAAREAMPPIGKRYAGATQVDLPAPNHAGEFPRVLRERRTWRRFSTRPLALADLATLLGLSSAIQYWVPIEGVGRLALKTYPSGGAQHPLEVYVLARRVAALAPGLYHYGSATHRLSLVRNGGRARDIRRYLPQQAWYGGAAAVLLITAVFTRTQWKYQSPRAYKVVLAEAGHLCQNLCLTATWLGLAPFCTMALADTVIERDLGIDGVNESVLYAAGVGTRPAGVVWAPSPTGQQITRVLGSRAGAPRR